jgi:hypothetical protein
LQTPPIFSQKGNDTMHHLIRHTFHRMTATAVLTGLASSLFTISSGAYAMSTEEIRLGYKKHAALAQFHRWYQLYENNAVPIENQLDILAKDISVKSGLGEGKGHEVYTQRIAQLPKTWKNAHFPRNIKVTIKADGSTEPTADLTYLNEGMKPGVVRSAELSYATALKGSDNVLPVFTQIEIKQKSEAIAPSFKDAYPENRIRSLVHYWLALIEDPARKIEPFKEILAEAYSLNFSSGTINDAASFEKWFRGPASTVSASTHELENFQYEVLSPTQFKMSVEMQWEGILPNNSEMTARTRHTWLIEDKPKERFACIKTVDMQLLKPFAPKVK